MVTYRFNPNASTISASDIQQKWSCLNESKSRYISDENKELMNQHYTLGCSDRNLITSDTSVSDNIRMTIGAEKIVDNGKTKLKLIQAESIFKYLDGVFVIDVEKIPKLNGTRSFISLINSIGDRINIINQVNEEDENQFNFFSSCDNSPKDVLRHNDDSGIYVCRILNNGETIQYWFFEEGSDGHRILKDADNKDIKFPEEVVESPIETGTSQPEIEELRNAINQLEIEKNNNRIEILNINENKTSSSEERLQVLNEKLIEIDKLLNEYKIQLTELEYREVTTTPRQSLSLPEPIKTITNTCIGGYGDPYRLYIGISLCEFENDAPHSNQNECLLNINLDFTTELNWVIRTIKFYGSATVERLRSPNWGTPVKMTTQDINYELEEPAEPTDNGDGTTSPPANTETTSPPANTGTTSPPANTGTTSPPVNTGTTSPPADTTDWDAYEDKVIYIFLGSYVGILVLFLLFFMFRKKS